MAENNETDRQDDSLISGIMKMGSPIQQLILAEPDPATMSENIEPSEEIDTVEAETPGTPAEGFEVYDPLGSTAECVISEAATSPESDGVDEEWVALGEKMVTLYGDTLSGVAGYMGPVGGILTLVGLGMLIFHSFKDLGLTILTGASATFIIGMFLLLFHSFHWISNRMKGRELSMEMNEKLLVKTCRHLDISAIEANELLLRCEFYRKEISEVPECMACGHYSPSTPTPVLEPSTGEATHPATEAEKLIP